MVCTYYVVQGASDVIEYPYSEIPTCEITSLSQIDPKYRGIYLIAEQYLNEKQKHEFSIWKWDTDKIYCVSNLFLPFARFNTPRKIIDDAFVRLINFDPQYDSDPYSVAKIHTKFTFENEYISIHYPKDKSQICVDYFQEEVRMACHRKNKNSHWQYYKKKYGLNFGTADYEKYDKLQIEIWNNYYSCTEIFPEMLAGLIKILRIRGYSVKDVLDMSAGRGSRLTAAISVPEIKSYLGTDPNAFSHDWYRTQANYYCDLFNRNIDDKMIENIRRDYRGLKIYERKDINYDFIFNNLTKESLVKNPDNFRVIQSGFETAEIGDSKYDIMFSSPPYFDTEIYSNDAQQSINTYNTLESWINDFMLVSMEKIIRCLRPGGLMCINITNSSVSEMDWVNPLLSFKSGCNYIGCIGFVKKHSAMAQPVFIWQKHNMAYDVLQPIKPWLEYFDVKRENADMKTMVKKYAEYRVPDAPKNTKKLSKKLKIIRVPTHIRDHEWPVWKIGEDYVEYLIYDSYIPFAMFVKKLSDISENLKNMTWDLDVSHEKYILPYNIVERVENKNSLHFCGKYVLIIAKTVLFDPLLYFIEDISWVCHLYQIDSMWIYFMNNYRELCELGDRDKIYWKIINHNLGCLTKNQVDLIYVVKYLRKRGYPMRRVLDFHMSRMPAVMFTFIHEGCDYYEGWNVNTESNEKIPSIFNYWNNADFLPGIKKFEMHVGDYPETVQKFDCVFTFIPSYNLYKYSETPNDLTQKYLRMTGWFDKYIYENIKRCSDLLETGGILCIHTVENLVNTGGWTQLLLTSHYANLTYLGCIGSKYKTTVNIFLTLVWQKL